MKVLAIAGPTSSGKTAAALELAERWDPIFVSADAMQVYRGMNIGTGKISPEILARYPHAGIDIRDPHESFNAVDFAELADGEIRRGFEESRPVVVVGGTGFYFRALLEGFVDAPSGDDQLRASLEALDDPYLELEKVDPVLAARLHPNDRFRILRGLEVHAITGQTLSSLHAAHRPEPRHPVICLGLDRPDLKERIDARVLQMLDEGYLEEVRTLVDMGYTPETTKPMRSLGYRHLSDHLHGRVDLDEAIRLTQRDTRKFAKRQRTLLRSIGGFSPCDASDMKRILELAQSAWGPERSRVS